MSAKKCNKCGIEKELSEFTPDRKCKGGLAHTCKICRAAYYKGKRQDPAYRQLDNDRRMKWHYDNYTQKKYGLSNEEYADLLNKQDHSCALCGQKDTGRDGMHKKSRWGVDHCHSTGKVRGILCHKCNVSLGHYERLKQDVGIEKIIAYLS